MRPVTPLKLSLLLCCVTAVLATGCGEPLPEEAEPLATLRSAEDSEDACPLGTCPNPRNGRGIYVAENFSYCIFYAPDDSYFCPERFSNQPNGQVILRGQQATTENGFPTVPTSQAFSIGGRWNDQVVDVLSVDADQGEFLVTVRKADFTTARLWGQGLSTLRLDIKRGDGLWFQLKFEQAPQENGVPLYRVRYNLGGTSTWQSYCADGVGTAAVLLQRTVDSNSAAVSKSSEETTLACRSGAIATCLVWGYSPEGAYDETTQNQRDFLYGSCLQAKRAAYFVESGDYQSYTVSGTPLALQDEYGIHSKAMPGVEALWTPKGASCLNPKFRRQPAPGAQPLPALPLSNPLPLCDPQLHQAAQAGTLQALLEDGAPLATGASL